MKRAWMLGALAALTVSAAAYAAQQDFVIVNNTGQTIMTLNVSPADEDTWGPDILGADVLAAGERGQVTFDRAEERCDWDLRVTYEDGDTGDWRGIDLCETAVIELS